jgi:hypothetical protein
MGRTLLCLAASGNTQQHARHRAPLPSSASLPLVHLLLQMMKPSASPPPVVSVDIPSGQVLLLPPQLLHAAKFAKQPEQVVCRSVRP